MISENTDQSRSTPSAAWALFWAGSSVVTLASLLVLTAWIDEDHPLGFVTPYRGYVVTILLVLFGIPAVESGSKVLLAIAQRRTSPDVAGALRIVARIAAYGIVISAVVSVLTSNAAAALTLGSFAGLVAGFTGQAVMGNALAGLFMAIARPIKVGDRVTIGSNSGIVSRISLMHTVLSEEDHETLIPSSNIVNAVLIRHKTNG